MERAIIENRIKATLSKEMVDQRTYRRFVRQLRIVSDMTGETMEQVAKRLEA